MPTTIICKAWCSLAKNACSKVVSTWYKRCKLQFKSSFCLWNCCWIQQFLTVGLHTNFKVKFDKHGDYTSSAWWWWCLWD
jgi:hypothetical protein